MPPRFVTVTCPSCLQRFQVAAPPLEELPTELDYDCEICCRPMEICIDVDGEEIRAEARGINE
ncbi:MAG TPA: CPXCG motif-containing cysteine-rich protein [Opitutaceae bacterium]|nr:CPXCG motif-containing cysteine-rich protein [Opitutaceae bacterium]